MMTMLSLAYLIENVHSYRCESSEMGDFDLNSFVNNNWLSIEIAQTIKWNRQRRIEYEQEKCVSENG